jgi:cellulose synthase/poly-beta-1,6-N-acetylglucosamine synthase-like glycosyltransferase
MLIDNSVIFFLVEVIFWLSVSIIFWTYALFPIILKLMAWNKTLHGITYIPEDDELPMVSVVISAFNEEQLIEAKIRSVFNTNYPPDKVEVLVGSDASTDNTNSILEQLQKEFSGLNFFPFINRRGKGNVVNDLIDQASGEILILTDANVILQNDTIFELVKFFRNPRIGLVDSQMLNTNIQSGGISFQERAYIAREVMIKYYESVLWGTMMGPFGGCYAIRKDLYAPVPVNFLVDDFYINMKILDRGYKCINNLEAKVFEDVSNNLYDEFKRKIRIATGNFQNLREFSHLLWHKTKGLSFCFISHKALRWTGPFFLIMAFSANLILAIHSLLYFYIFVLHCLLFILPLPDLLMKRSGVNISILRFITHFYSMNLALLAGFFKSLKKIESNVWKPTQRNQA